MADSIKTGQFELEMVNIRLNHDRTLYSDTALTSPDKIVKFLQDELRDYDREHFVVINLNTKGQPININTVSIGDLSHSMVNPREVFKGSVLSNAASVILVHNHPSGNPEPSRQDEAVTQKLVDAGAILGIRVLDHIVIGRDDYISFCQENIMPQPSQVSESSLAYEVNEPEMNYTKDKKESFRDKVAAAFVNSLEEDPIGWVKKWASNDTGKAFNMASGREYSGVNAVWLKFVEKNNGYSDPRWLTFNQVRKLNEEREDENKIIIPKGTKMTPVEYFFMYDNLAKKTIPWDEYNSLSEEEKHQRVDTSAGELVTDAGLMGTSIKDRFELRSRDHYVFNASQLENIPEYKFDRVVNEISPSEVVDRVSSGMGVEIRELEQDRAYYSPGLDRITLPLKTQFNTDYDYQSTALHELGHATGHYTRLNRDQGHRFGSRKYAYEELIAEMTSAFMGEYFPEPMSEDNLNEHKAYIQNWIEAIKNDKNYLFRAIKEAEKAADYMVEKGSLEELKQLSSQVAENEASYNADNTLSLSVKTWYKETYPTDELGDELFDTVDFNDINNHINTKEPGENIYDLLGVGDSLVRERVFSKLAELTNKDYMDIYELWLENEQGSLSGISLENEQESTPASSFTALKKDDFIFDPDLDVSKLDVLENPRLGKYIAGYIWDTDNIRASIPDDIKKEIYNLDGYPDQYDFYPIYTENENGEPHAEINFVVYLDNGKQGSAQEYTYSLSEPEEQALISAMEDFSKSQYNMSLHELYTEEQEEEQLSNYFKNEIESHINSNEVLVAHALQRALEKRGIALDYEDPDSVENVIATLRASQGEQTSTQEQNYYLFNPELSLIGSVERYFETDDVDIEITYPGDEDRAEDNHGLIATLGWYTNSGEDRTEDFIVEGKDEEELVQNLAKEIADRYQDWDADEYVGEWIAAKNNGVAGVPSVTELVETSEEIETNYNTWSSDLNTILSEYREYENSKEVELTATSDHISIEGYSGTWYVVDDATRNGEPVFLLEHEQEGDETEHLIVDKNANVIYDDVWNGFNDMYERDGSNPFEELYNKYPEEVRPTIQAVASWLGEEWNLTDQEIIDSFDDISNIGLTYTTDAETGEHKLQAALDLSGDNPIIKYMVDGVAWRNSEIPSYGFIDYINGLDEETLMSNLLTVSDDVLNEQATEYKTSNNEREVITNSEGQEFIILNAEITWQEGSLRDGNFINGQRFESLHALEEALIAQDIEYRESGDRGYDKTGVKIDYITPDNKIHTYEDRYDVGDGVEFMNVTETLTNLINTYEKPLPFELTDDDKTFIESLNGVNGYELYSKVTDYLEEKSYITNDPFNYTDEDRLIINGFQMLGEETEWDGKFNEQPIIMLVPMGYEGNLPDGMYYSASSLEAFGYDFWKVENGEIVTEENITVNDINLGKQYYLGYITRDEAHKLSDKVYQNAKDYLETNVKLLPEYAAWREDIKTQVNIQDEPIDKLSLGELITGIEDGKDYNNHQTLTNSERLIVRTLVNTFRDDLEKEPEKEDGRYYTIDDAMLNRVSQFFFFTDHENLTAKVEEPEAQYGVEKDYRETKEDYQVVDTSDAFPPGENFAIWDEEKDAYFELEDGTIPTFETRYEAIEGMLANGLITREEAEKRIGEELLEDLSELRPLHETIVEKLKELPSEVHNQGYYLVDVSHMSKYEDESHLYSVLGRKMGDSSYARWYYDTNDGLPKMGQEFLYDMNYDVARLEYYGLIDNDLKPPYRIAQYLGTYESNKFKDLSSEDIIDDGNSVCSVIGYYNTEEQGRAEFSDLALANKGTQKENDGYVSAKTVALEYFEYDSDGDLISTEVIACSEKPVEYNAENRTLSIEKDESGNYYAKFDTKEANDGVMIPFDGKGYIDSFNDFAKHELSDKFEPWKEIIEGEPEKGNAKLINLYLDNAPDALDKSLSDSFSLTAAEKEEIKDFFKEELKGNIDDTFSLDIMKEVEARSLERIKANIEHNLNQYGYDGEAFANEVEAITEYFHGLPSKIKMKDGAELLIEPQDVRERKAVGEQSKVKTKDKSSDEEI